MNNVEINRHTIAAVALASALVLLSACSPGGVSNSAATKAINEGLAKDSGCASVPVDVPATREEIAAASRALQALQAKGLVKEGAVQQYQIMGPAKPVNGYVFTEAAKPLIQQPAMNNLISKQPCVRTGHYEVKSIEAIDMTAGVDGKPIASVRARLRFVTEDWITATRPNAAWSEFWKAQDAAEQNQYLYSLLKSGSEVFYTGRGVKLQ